MPCMGPDENKEGALQAFQEIMELLESKYSIYPNKLLHPKLNQEEMDAAVEKLKAALLDIFRIESWDSW